MLETNPVQKAIADIFNKLIKTKAFETHGVITKFDHDTYLADVKVIDPNGQEEILSDIPVTFDTKGGVFGSSLKCGHGVIVSFIDGVWNPQKARIIRRADRYQDVIKKEAHTVHGTLDPDDNVNFY